jgi:hypothetical protein
VKDLKTNNNVQEAKSILKKLGVTPGPDEDVFRLLQNQIKAAAQKGEESIDALIETFGIQPK